MTLEAFKMFSQSHETLQNINVELEAARRRVKELKQEKTKPLESKSNNEVLKSLTELLQGSSMAKTVLMKDGEVYSGQKKDYYPWKESILLKLKNDADHF